MYNVSVVYIQFIARNIIMIHKIVGILYFEIIHRYDDTIYIYPSDCIDIDNIQIHK